MDECGLQGKRERERGLGHEVEHGVFEVGDSRLVLGWVVVVFLYKVASISLFGEARGSRSASHIFSLIIDEHSSRFVQPDTDTGCCV